LAQVGKFHGILFQAKIVFFKEILIYFSC